MRQGNGSDLLGLKDPRSTKIGIIYVASNDDRKSVLAAILTQEKLGRKQIAIVLPENQPNKAFQYPQDFDDLKTVRRKLRAQLIFVVPAGLGPAGLGPAELARQRRFNVYSSLESYTDALRAESLPAETRNKGKRDRFFGFGRKTVPLVTAAVGGATAMALSGKKDQKDSNALHSSKEDMVKKIPSNSSTPDADSPTPGQDQQISKDKDKDKDKDNELALPVSEAGQVPSTPAADIDDIDDAVASSTTISVASSVASAATGIVAADLINKSAQPIAPDVSSTSVDDDWDALPPVPSMSSPQKNVSITNSALNATPPPPPTNAPNTPDLVVGTGPGIIELPPSPRTTSGRATAKLPAVSGTTAATNSAQSSSATVSRNSFQRSNTGKMAATTIAASAPSSHRSSASRSPVQGGKARQTGVRQKKRGLVGFVIAILVVALLLLCGGVASFATGLPLFQFGLPLVSNAAPATITITPDSKLEQGSYVIQAVAGNPDRTQRQVSLRQLTFSPSSQSKLVTATGVGHVPAQAAIGQLTFYNGSNQAFMVGSTTAIPGPNGISVETDGPANIPAAHPPTEGTITVDAHVTAAGASGNMAAGAINETCCTSGGFITVVSSAFTGGQDEQDYKYLQQSDVDGYVNQMKPTLSQQALNALKGQLKPNEQLAGDPQCTTQSSQDQPIGDQGHNVPSANVTVNATCTGLAYDAREAQALAQDLLRRKAVNDLGQAYVLAGTIVTKLTVTDTDSSDGVVTLQVAVAGTWYYRFDDKQKQALASQLVNKTRAAAQGFLNTNKGIAKANIDIANGGNSLPSDPKQISIVVVTVSGVSATNLPPLPAVEPTSPLSTSKGRG